MNPRPASANCRNGIRSSCRTVVSYLSLAVRVVGTLLGQGGQSSGNEVEGELGRSRELSSGKDAIGRAV